MKKQILFLVVFVLAAFAGVNKSYGQGTPQAPVPGSPQVYSVTGTPGGGTYVWNIIDGAVETDALNGATADASYFTASPSGGNYTVTWTPAAIGKTFYVVSKYTVTAASPATCDVMNMRVFEVKPVNTFVLTVTLAKSDGSANAEPNVCPPPIASATITGTNVQMDYGVTTLYYNVKAEGLNGVWQPKLRIPALGTSQVYQSVKFDGTALTIATDGTQQDLTISPDVAVSIAGTDYLVEVVIAHNAYAPTTPQSISLEADGTLGTDHTMGDVLTTIDPTPAGDFGTATVKKATYSIVPRPDMSTTLTPGFMPIVP